MLFTHPEKLHNEKANALDLNFNTCWYINICFAKQNLHT